MIYLNQSKSIYSKFFSITIKTFYLIFILNISIASSRKSNYNQKFFNGIDDLSQEDQLIFDRYFDRHDEPIEYSLDIGIKLKRDFSDDLVSDLFAASHGLEKISRVCNYFLKKLY